MLKRAALTGLITASLFSHGARAQINMGPNPVIGGIPMVCGGVVTVVYPHGAIGDIARAVPGQIMLDQAFATLPPYVQRFVWGHECGHHLGGNEMQADCTAVQFGKHQGWLTWGGLQQVKTLLVQSAGDWTHLPGPQRIQLLEACWQKS